MRTSRQRLGDNVRATYSVTVFCALAVFGCGNTNHSVQTVEPGATVHAKVATATISSSTQTREAVGTVRSATTSAIQSKVVGHVIAIHVKAGDLVEVNSVLAELDSRDAAAQVKSAESALRLSLIHI